MSRVVIFGGNGFIGSTFALYLANNGHDVLTFGRNASSLSHPKIQHTIADFDNPSSWKGSLKKDDYVCFLIPLHMPNKVNQASDAETHHLTLISELLKECAANKVKNFLFLSSGGALYGRGDRAFTESDTPNPVSAYGKIKLKIETLILEFQKKEGLSISIARPSNVYGEKQNPLVSFGAVSTFYYRIKNDIPLDVFGSLDICKDYLHVDDLIVALSAMSVGDKPGIYNLSLGQSHTLEDIVKKVEKVLGKKAVIKFHPALETDVQKYRLDSSKAKLELNFSPKINLDAGIERYFKQS